MENFIIFGLILIGIAFIGLIIVWINLKIDNRMLEDRVFKLEDEHYIWSKQFEKIEEVRMLDG